MQEEHHPSSLKVLDVKHTSRLYDKFKLSNELCRSFELFVWLCSFPSPQISHPVTKSSAIVITLRPFLARAAKALEAEAFQEKGLPS